MTGRPNTVLLPPPTAVSEERPLVGALLAGHVALVDLVPLTPGDFYDRVHAAVVVGLEAIDATGRAPRPALLVVAMRSQGIGGTDEALVELLCQLQEDAPQVLDVPFLVGAVLEASRRRQLSRLLRAADMDLRTGAATAGQVRARLLGALDG